MIRRFNLLAVRHSVVWLLAIALLVPLAHIAALAHGFSHIHADANSLREGDRKAPSQACEICLIDAAVTGGALPATVAAPLVIHGPDAAPRHTDTSLQQRQPRLGYLSRAPPVSGP
jgi:hypothetical protein